MIVMQLDPAATAADAMRTLRVVAEEHPGEHGLTVKSGDRTLELGSVWTYSGSPECLRRLGAYGSVRVLAAGESA